jgi:hypothetical protein
MFGEITLTARSDAGTGSPPAASFNAEVERIIIRYDANDYFKVSFGHRERQGAASRNRPRSRSLTLAVPCRGLPSSTFKKRLLRARLPTPHWNRMVQG